MTEKKANFPQFFNQSKFNNRQILSNNFKPVQQSNFNRLNNFPQQPFNNSNKF